MSRCAQALFFTTVSLWCGVSQAEIDVLGYDLAIDLDVEARSLSAEARVTFVADGAEQIELDFVGFEVERVLLEGEPVEFAREGRGLIVEASPGAGAEVVLEVVYSGPPEPYVEPWGSWGVVFEPEAVFTVNVIEGARHWFPAHDDLSDRATLSLRVTTPSDWHLAGPGERGEVREVGEGRIETAWVADWPLPTYQMHFAAAPYEVIEQMHSGVPFIYWLKPRESQARALETLDHAPVVLEMLEGLYGPYPFPKVGFDEINLGGAVENASCVSIGSQILDSPNEFGEIIAHEMAHAWFQGVVTVETWEDLWLSEGLATYHEAIYAGHLGGESGLRDYAASLALGYKSVAQLGEGIFPIYDPDVLFGVTVYRKGAVVFHMLRYLVGEPAFESILSAYLANFAFDAATTQEFKAVAEAASGVDLGPFFDQWVFGAGWPDYKVSWQTEAAPSGGFVVDLRLRQVQDQGPFTLPVEVLLEGGDASEIVRLDVDSRDVRARVEVPFEALSVKVDPSSWLLKDVEEEAFEAAPEPDPMPDPEPAVDVGPSEDVGVPDTGGEMPPVGDDVEDEGCGCVSVGRGGRAQGPGPWALVFGVLVFGVGRRRRR